MHIVSKGYIELFEEQPNGGRLVCSGWYLTRFPYYGHKVVYVYISLNSVKEYYLLND